MELQNRYWGIMRGMSFMGFIGRLKFVATLSAMLGIRNYTS